LYGHKEDLPLIASAATSRELALNSPMAYHLLPTDSYLMSESESVAHFEGDRAYGLEIAAYGATIDSWHELSSFVQASEGGRVRPDSNNLDRAGIGNPTLLSYAQDIHDEIDTWQPPSGVTLHQVAGWGVDTFVGVKLQEFSLPWFDTVQEYYTPLFAKRGDEVVPASSSLLIEASDNSNRYWIDLDKLEDRAGIDYTHANLFEIDSVITLINSILFNEPDAALPDNFYASEPAIDETRSWFRFFLHSPLTLEVFDADGNRVGLNEDGTIDSQIEDGAHETFGGVQFIIVPDR